jgi:outer membrane biosynthesis protein TonB
MDLSPLSLSDLAKLSAPAQPLPPSDYPINLMLERREVRSNRQIAAIGAGSLLVHLIAFLIATEIPSLVQQSHPERVIVEHKTPLYFPRELTQKASNRNKISKDIDLAALMASRRDQNQHQASPSPSARHFEPPKNVGVPQREKATLRIMPDAPNLALNQAPADVAGGAINGVQAAPPPLKASPSLLETAGTQAPPKIAPPKTPPPPGVTRPILSDDSQSVPAPALPGIAGQTSAEHAAIELRSDPQGADFKPYLEQILAIVRGNWQRVTPEGVRQGRLHGRSVIDFIINRDGSIARVIVAEPSGLNQLDFAASTSLVMSSPLPRLPVDFKGFQVRLAFTFAYNMPIR